MEKYWVLLVAGQMGKNHNTWFSVEIKDSILPAGWKHESGMINFKVMVPFLLERLEQFTRIDGLRILDGYERIEK